MDYQKQIREYIVSNFLFGVDDDLTNDTSFLDAGIIDSTGVLELISFAEERFEIKIAEQEIIPENLDNINRLAEFLRKKVAEKSAVAK